LRQLRLGFAYGVSKVHKTAQDLLRQLDYTCLLAVSKQLAGDDQRAVAFLVTHDRPFTIFSPANSNPSLSFSQREFHIALSRKNRKMGSFLSFLLPYIGASLEANPQLCISLPDPYIGARIKSNWNSRPTFVDHFGNGIVSASGVPGYHFRLFSS